MLRNARHAAYGLVLTAVALIVTGCTALGGPADNASNNGPLEKSSITVATVPTVDLAPFWIAIEKGYFKAQGLDVKEVSAPTTQIALTKTLNGEADVGLATYPAMILAKSQGAGDLRFVSDGTSASPKSNALLTVPNSPVKTIQDLAGKRIAISAKNQSSDIMTRSVMRDHGVDFSTVKWIEMPLPSMAAALQRGDVDAIYQPEPFITQAARTVGAFPIVDVATGGTLGFPITGYASLGKWVQANPKTLAAFQRAMRDAARDATAHRETVQSVVVIHAKVDPDTAALMTLPDFQSTLDVSRIQRVPDLLLQLGAISAKVDVTPMIAPQLAN